MRVYLAGGMRKSWREQFKETVRHFNVVCLDPCDQGFTEHEPHLYTPWDMLAVKSADAVFAYLEKDNPSGIGMAFEIGYALALGKTVFFVNEQMNNRYTRILMNSGAIVMSDLERGIVVFLKFLRGFEDV